MSLGERVRTFRRTLKLRQDQLAALVTKKGGFASQSTISDIELGKSVDPHCVPQLAEIFGVTEKDLRNGGTPLPIAPKPNVRELPQPVGELRLPLPPESGDKPVATVVTFWGRRAEARGAGVWLIYPERAAGLVELGPSLAQAPRSFKVEVLDALNSPVYEQRDVLWCDPDREPLEGKNYCIFVGQDGIETDGGVPALLGKLVRATDEAWIVKPFAGDEQTLPRSTWPHAWVVYRCDRAV